MLTQRLRLLFIAAPQGTGTQLLTLISVTNLILCDHKKTFLKVMYNQSDLCRGRTDGLLDYTNPKTVQ